MIIAIVFILVLLKRKLNYVRNALSHLLVPSVLMFVGKDFKWI